MRAFSDVLDPEDVRRVDLRSWPSYNYLLGQPTLSTSQNDDLKLETESWDGTPLRYWVDRSWGIKDRPQTDEGHYIGGWPRVTVEACLDGRWKLIAGYQGNMC